MKTEAQKRATRKYMDKNYKNLAIRIRPEKIEMIDSYCKSIEMSKASTIVNAIKYLKEENVNLKKWIADREAKSSSICGEPPVSEKLPEDD